jgi:hypothetical protein
MSGTLIFRMGPAKPLADVKPRAREKIMNKSRSSQQKTKVDVRASERVKLGPDIKAKIGQQLRLMYGQVVDRGVPNRFVEMLKRLNDPTGEGSKE